MENLSVQQFVARINQGGWFLVGGKESGFRASIGMVNYSEATAGWDGDYVSIVANKQHVFPDCEISFHEEEGKLEIRKTYIRQEMRKKIEGGGWRDVQYTGVVLRFLQQKTIDHIVCERERQQEEKRKKEEEAAERYRQKREQIQRNYAAEKLKRQQAFVQRFNDEFGDALTATVRENVLILTLKDGRTVRIENHYDYDSGFAVVNGVSMETFEHMDDYYR